MGLRWWSWQLALPGVSLIVLLVAMHFFVAPLVPTFFVDPSALVFQRINDTHGWDIERALECEEEHGAIVYRNATWKAEVGCWLSQCGNSAVLIPIVEKFWKNNCNSGCNGRGVCHNELAQCRCSVGFSGAGCEREINRVCNRDVTKEQPYGSWGVSMCPGLCDKRTSHCLCGNTTNYPDRPLAEACGFRLKEDGWAVDWTRADTDYIYGNETYKGWCNLDAKDVLEQNFHVKDPQCDCKYDGRWGVVCESPSESFCINQCNDNGFCQQGYCACRKGWYGIDCSVPSYLPPPEKRPTWLRQEAASNVSDKTNQSSVPATTMKKRPLVYVYDLPAEFSSQLLQGRHFKFQCVNRLYSVDNVTEWTENLYGAEVINSEVVSVLAQIALYESLLASEHRTTNGNEADFFYVPLLHACIVEQGDAAPHLSTQGKYMGLRQYFAGDYSKQVYFHIQQNYPYWNRSAGRDHIWFFPWDEGACSAPKEIWNSMMLAHWGNTNAKHKTSTTAYPADDWDPIPPEWRGDHPCYDPAKDLVLPAWKFPDPYPVLHNFSSRPRQDRPTLFYFNGNLGSAYENGRPEPGYSMGIRQRLAAEFGSQLDKKGLLGRQAADDVVVQAQRSPEYKLDLSKSRFCGVFPGDGWSGRMEDSILNGCIPVIIQDGIHLPFENVLDYESFTVRVAEDDIDNLTTILRAINETQVDSMLSAVRGMWQRFTYHHAVKLEAKRQKLKYNSENEWAAVYNSLTDDDAFSTFIQLWRLPPYTLRVLVALRELGVSDYKWAPVNMAAPVKEHHSIEFKSKLQPFGQVPVMHDDDLDLTLFESRAVTRYLAEKFQGQGTPLLGNTPREKALVDQWTEVESQNFNKPVGQITLHTIFAKNFGITSNPELVLENLAKLEKVLDVYEAHLAGSKYLAGEFFSLADLHHLPATHLLINVAKKGDGFTSKLHVSAWSKDISSRPAFRDGLAFQKSRGP